MVLSSDSVKVDDRQQVSVDELCLSVNSISLNGTSVETVTEHVVNEQDAPTEHRIVEAADEDESRGIDDTQPLQLDGRTSPPAQNPTEEEFMSRLESIEVEGKKEAKIGEDSKTKLDEDKDWLSAGVSENDERILSAEQREGGTVVSPKPRQRVPQEHDETTNEVVDQTRKNDETTWAEIVGRGPIGGVPTFPENGQPPAEAYAGDVGGFAGGYGDAPKYRKPLVQYTPPAAYQPPDIAHFTLMAGGQVSVFNDGWEQSWWRQCGGFGGGFGPCQMASSFPGGEEFVGECAETSTANSSFMSSGEYDTIMKSLSSVGPSGNLPVPTDLPPNTSVGISAIMSSDGDLDAIVHSLTDGGLSESLPVPTEMPQNVSLGISAPRVNAYTTASPSKSSGSPAFDRCSDCISPGLDCSPENPFTTSALSPTSTVADSGCGLDEEWDDLMKVLEEDLRQDQTIKSPCVDDALEVIKDDLREDEKKQGHGRFFSQFHQTDPDSTGFYAGQHLRDNPLVRNLNPGNPHVGNPRSRNSSEKNPSVKHPMAEVVIPCTEFSILSPSLTSDSSAISTSDAGQVPYIIVSQVSTQPQQMVPIPPGFRKILPRPPDYQKKDVGSHPSANTGLFTFLCDIRSLKSHQRCCCVAFCREFSCIVY